MQKDKRRILCVEDDKESCEVMSVLLQQVGYEVSTAQTVSEGLRLARSGNFSLILLDSLYSDGTGIELCKKIRGLDSRTTILFYTGLSDDVKIREGMDAGAQGYFIKPDIEALLSAISDRTYSAIEQNKE